MEGLHYDEKIDVYSFGVLLTEIITRRKPFSDQFEIRHYQDVFDAVLDNGAVPTIPNWTSNFLEPLVMSCISRDPTSRPSFTDIILYLQEFFQLSGRDFFLRFDFPRLMESLASAEPRFQAIAANEIASLAFAQRKREEVFVPEWYVQTDADRKAANSADFHLISHSHFSNMIDKLCVLFSVKYASVQLASCHALSSLLRLFPASSRQRKEYTSRIIDQNVHIKLFRLLMKDNQQLSESSSDLLLTLSLSTSSYTDFLTRFRSKEELQVFDAYIQREVKREQNDVLRKKRNMNAVIKLGDAMSGMLGKGNTLAED
jgi:serine/threonine protein kinase